MKKLALMFALVGVAGLAAAQDPQPAPAQAEKMEAKAAKTHEVEAEIVSFDAAAKTVTIKGTPDNQTVPVDAKAVAALKDVKPGEKVTLVCRDDENGKHQAVTGVKITKK